EQWRVSIALFPDLLPRRDACIQTPGRTLEPAGPAAIDVAGAENAEAPSTAHDHRAMLVLQLPGLAAIPREREHVAGVADDWQRHAHADKRRIVPPASEIVLRHALDDRLLIQGGSA